MNFSDIIPLLTSAWRDYADSVERDRLEAAFRRQEENTIEAERDKKHCDVLRLAKLKTELRLCQKTYEIMAKKHGRIDAVEQYIADAENRIIALSHIKNKTR